ncbi:MAG: AbrB/MazE/SpoVT family DNA-binding domain-containing protein [Chloroflexi bacterium]|nr:AbrB/MazE/SpoVT family DNA-binding domain-containing protein [Chloroflexota bacterium]
MKRLYATVTASGEVAIPDEVRELLGLSPNDQVAFAIEDNQVYLVRAALTLEEAYGSIKPQRQPEDWEEAKRLAGEDKIDREYGAGRLP